MEEKLVGAVEEVAALGLAACGDVATGTVGPGVAAAGGTRDGDEVEAVAHAPTMSVTSTADAGRTIRYMSSSSRVAAERSEITVFMGMSSWFEPLPARGTDDQPIHDRKRQCGLREPAIDRMERRPKRLRPDGRELLPEKQPTVG